MSATTPARTSLLPWTLFTVLVLIWGSSFILMKKGLVALTPLQIGGLRMVAAGVALLPIAVHHLRKSWRYPWGILTAVCLMGNLLPAILFPLATQRLPSGIVGTMNALVPLFTLLIGYLFFQASFRPLQVVGVLLGLVGSALLIWSRGGSTPMDAARAWTGAALVLACTILYGTSLNIVKRHLSHFNALEMTSLLLQPAALLGLGILLGSDFPATAVRPEAWGSIAAIVLLGTMGTALALWLFYRLVNLTTPVFAASNTYAVPVVALGWGLLDGEQLTWLVLPGLGLILAGVLLVNRGGRVAK